MRTTFGWLKRIGDVLVYQQRHKHGLTKLFLNNFVPKNGNIVKNG